jgi:3-isopropylmalate dehydrogenase
MTLPLSRPYRIALLPGDGIGPEVTREAVRVLDRIGATSEVRLSYTEYSVGAEEYLRNGDPLPPQTLEAIRGEDAILLGAMGLPDVRWPNGVEMTPQIDIREQLDLYNGVRPIYLYHPLHSPLRDQQAGGIDFVLVRESTEGLFWARKAVPKPDADFAEDTMRVTRRGAERVIRAAFELARKRRKHCTLVDKANVLPSMAYFRGVFDQIATQEYPDIATNRVYVDAAALFLVQRPAMFDVMVTENMFGDILSDLAAGLVGGMGMAPSADIGDKHAVFQPSHGTAPDIAGKGIANPVATILSAALMLDWLGHPAEAQRIETAVKRVLADPQARTRDLGGSMSTSEMGAAVVAAIGN